MAAKRRYGVFNHTDGIWASSDPMTLDEAEDFSRDFPLRYAKQGYYLTSSWKRIPPEDVELEIVPIDEE